jgi:hypothetical protein
MHLASLRILSSSSALGGFISPPLGIRCLHAFCAASTFPRSAPSPWIAIDIPLPSPAGFGSGMSTPCSRMHLAKSRILSSSLLPLLSAAAGPPVFGGVEIEATFDPSSGFAPQPPSSRAVPRAATAIRISMARLPFVRMGASSTDRGVPGR